jgi:GTP cyclohydrolase IA
MNKENTRKYDLDLLAIGWESLMEHAIISLLKDERISGKLPNDHIAETPVRVVKAYKEAFRGVNIDIVDYLSKSFIVEDVKSLGMIIVKDIPIVSLCMHHLLPFVGKAYFGYIPSFDKVIGISKIPRFIDALAGRPQIQEKLSADIVNSFYKIVRPYGCGVVIEAQHMCMSLRGVKATTASLRTISLKGNFLSDPSVKQEFMESIK